MKRIVIIGGGVVGCAIAYELSTAKADVHLLEREAKVGEGVTSRNSGVIHSGLYYSPESLKAKLCIEGQRLLYDWCHQWDVPHKKVGKLILAQEREEQALSALYENAMASGVLPAHLKFLSQEEVLRLNPYLRCSSALYAPQSGILDVQRFCQSLYIQAAKRSVQFHFNCDVRGIESGEDYRIITHRGDLTCDLVVNAAGLYADQVAAMAGVHHYRIYPWRGDYFKVKLPYPVSQLVYPVKTPSAAGLGIHMTPDLRSNLYLGPDSELILSKDDFRPRADKKRKFYEAASRMFSGLSIESLEYETCGIRPKLRSPEETKEKDFVISEDRPGLINLVGMESPGLTAALAIARFVKNKL